jgi:hypothetical protein
MSIGSSNKERKRTIVGEKISWEGTTRKSQLSRLRLRILRNLLKVQSESGGILSPMHPPRNVLELDNLMLHPMPPPVHGIPALQVSLDQLFRLPSPEPLAIQVSLDPCMYRKLQKEVHKG